MAAPPWYPYLPASALTDKKKKEKKIQKTQQDNTELQKLPNRLLDVFMLSQKPFQAGTSAKFNPGVSF